MIQKNVRFFRDREHAGMVLARRLEKYSGEEPIILAMPRGGVPVAYQISKTLNATLNVVVVRKISLSSNKEFGFGAIAEDGSLILDQRTISLMGLSLIDLETAISEVKAELKDRIKLYRQNNPLPSLKNKVVILVDDGLATGVTARAAIKMIKKLNSKKIILASPVCAYDAVLDLAPLVMEVVSIITPVEFSAVGNWYENFSQLSDKEVIEILSKSR